jgi:endonuclease/exonuclease/phosphatase family metal-dependent hydrolase
VLWGRSPADRVGELLAIAAWLADWASSAHAFHHNLIALGDFNIDRRGDPRYEAFTSTGLTVPAALHEVPRTIFGSHLDSYYDQIAWFTDEDSPIPKLTLEPTGAAGSFDFTGLVHRHLTRQQLSWRISDHLPLWVEFAH